MVERATRNPFRSADVIVAGLGAMGSCTLAELARRGVRAIGIDRFAPPHDLGSSHGGSRVIRTSYFEHPDYVPLLRHAYAGYDRLSAEAGERLRHETGLVVAGEPGNPTTFGMLESARLHGIAVEALDGAELVRRHPAFDVPPDWEVAFEPTGGFVRPEATIRAALGVARAHGAEVVVEAPIKRWEARPGGVAVETSAGRFEAASLVLACGAWMPEVVGAAVPDLVPTRETILWLSDEGRSEWRDPGLPVWLFDRGAAPAVYGVPAFDGMEVPRGMKVGLHGRGPRATPASIHDPIDPAIVEETVRATDERVRGAGRVAIAGARHCLYTMSRDAHFVIDRHPDHANVAIACGFSGHGFKFAPVVGEALADLALEGATPLPIGFLSLRRFR